VDERDDEAAVATEVGGDPSNDVTSVADLDALDGVVIAGRYEVAQIVSLGANTVIVDALDVQAGDPSGHPVTLKIVRPHLAARPDFMHKFGVLADLSQALTHPNISSVLDWGRLEVGEPGATQPTVFWVVDAFGGGSLRDLLDRGRTLTPGQALVVGLEACRALDAAHQRGLFHTELTPSKMVFGADRRLRIVDFGLARLLAESTWEDPASVPTHVARYASPEQAIGVDIDAKTDVYALALVLVEAVTGEVPFSADSTVATLAGRVDRLLPVSADLGALAAILERAARPEAADRYSASELGRALVQAAPKLPRPEPIPVLSTGMFDTTSSSMRRPTDPTGGVDRPDDDSTESADDAGEAEHLAGVAAAGAAVLAAGAAATVAAGADAIPAPEAPAADVESAAPTADAPAPDAPAPDAPPVDPPVADAAPAPDVPAVDPPVADSVDATEATVEAPLADASLDTPDDADVVAEPKLPDESEITPVPAVAPGDDLHFTDELLAEAETTASPAVVPDANPSTEQMPASLIVGDPDGVAAPAEAPAVFDDEPRRRRKGPLIIIGLVLLAGLAALGYAATLLFQPNSFAVPVLAGQPVDRALNQIAGNEWEVSYEYERSDSFPDPQQVIRTVPEPGAELEEGEPFVMVLSEGPEFRTLPDLIERSFDDAAGELAGLGLNVVESPDREFSETLPVGAVVSWQVIGNATLVAGDQILPGESVELTLSAGPAPRDVPSLAGLSLDDAIARAGDLQLEVVSGEGVFSGTVPEGLVVSQTPGEGESLERDGTITVQLSLGPDIVPLPPLDGLTFTEAQVVLNDAGFVVGRLLGTTEGTFVELTIDGEEVAPGTEFPRGTVVDVIFL